MALGEIDINYPSIKFADGSVCFWRGNERRRECGDLLGFGGDEVFAMCDAGVVCLVEGEEGGEGGVFDCWREMGS